MAIFTQVQCGQNGASSRDFQYTVSTPVIFIGPAALAKRAYVAANGAANMPLRNDLLVVRMMEHYNNHSTRRC